MKYEIYKLGQKISVFWSQSEIFALKYEYFWSKYFQCQFTKRLPESDFHFNDSAGEKSKGLIFLL